MSKTKLKLFNKFHIWKQKENNLVFQYSLPAEILHLIFQKTRFITKCAIFCTCLDWSNQYSILNRHELVKYLLHLCKIIDLATSSTSTCLITSIFFFSAII